MSDVGSDAHVSPSHLIRNIVEDLFSYDTVKRKRILEYYFFEDATLSSPFMSTEGITNIQYVYTVWQTLNRTEPTINNIVFDGHTAVIHLTQNISPCIFPSFIHFQVPSITTLHFRETAGIPSPPPYDHSYRSTYSQQTTTANTAMPMDDGEHPPLYSSRSRYPKMEEDDLESMTSYDSLKTKSYLGRHQHLYHTHQTTAYDNSSDREGGEGGIIKIYKQEDSWTLEGLLQSVPLISYWYNHILRLLMGKIVTATGDLLDAAIQQAERLTIRGQEIQQMGRNMAIDNIEKIEEYRTDLQENYIRGLKQWRLQQEQQQQLLLTEPEERSLLLDDIHMNCNKEGHLEGCPCQQQHQLGQLLPTLPYTDSDATSSRFRSEESIDYQYRSGRGLFR